MNSTDPDQDRAETDQGVRLQACLRSMFPAAAQVRCGQTSVWGVSEAVESEPECVKVSCEKRRVEFKAGRALARKCLEELSVEGGGLMRREKGDIEWPSGYTGSISHAGPWCLAAVAPEASVAGLGIDLENTERMTGAIAARIMSDTERKSFNALPGINENEAATLCFCAKEAIYKALHPLTGTYLSFADAEIMPREIDRNMYSFRVEIKKAIAVNNDMITGYGGMVDQWALAGVCVAGSAAIEASR